MSEPTSASKPGLSASEAIEGLPLQFGRYRLEQRLGKGGMAEVFRARLIDKDFEKPICIKRVLPELASDPTFITMLKDEARTAARLQHANIVQVFELGEEHGVPYLAMELVEGVTLSQMLKNRVKLSVAQALTAAIGVARALDCAHNAMWNGKPLEVIHRDVTPHNVLVSMNGEVKLADFGIARARERLTETRTGIIKGKAAYMAPEQALDQHLDHRVDQFALGIVLWELLTAHPLFKRRGEHATLDAVAKAKVDPPSSDNPEVTDEIDKIVLMMLARDRNRRFLNMADCERALSDALFHVARSPSDGDLRDVVRKTRKLLDPPPEDGTEIDRSSGGVKRPMSGEFPVVSHESSGEAAGEAIHDEATRPLAVGDTTVALPSGEAQPRTVVSRQRAGAPSGPQSGPQARPGSRSDSRSIGAPPERTMRSGVGGRVSIGIVIVTTLLIVGLWWLLRAG
jgi:serine/threonine protein kinase